MSDEDFDPFVGGPPPDPSERTWRHPSEIAAQANADAMAELAAAKSGRWAIPGWRRTSKTSAIVAGSLGAAACLTGLALFQFIGAGNPQGTDLLEAADAPGTVEGGIDLEIAAAATVLTTTTTTFDTTSSAPAASLALPAAGTAAVEDQLVGIAIGTDLVASGVLVDGYLITSASIVGNQLSVSYSHRDEWSLAYLVGIDPFSDLAVFRPSAESRAGQTLEALTSNMNRPAHEWNDDAPETAPDPAAQVIVATLTTDGVESSIGNVLGAERNGMTEDGQPLIGLIETSIRRPEHCGGLLLDAAGNVVGISVNTASSLTSAVPIHDAIAIADRLTRQGWANETWIGFVGIDREPGVEVIDVSANGPAEFADLRPGDMIRYLDGARIDHMGGITAGLRRADPGDLIILVVERDGELIALRVEVSAYTPTGVTGAGELVDAVQGPGGGDDPVNEPAGG